MNEHQAHVYSMARQVWDSEKDADAFMSSAHPLLDGKTPLEASVSAEGARQVEDILNKIYWGLPR